MNALVLNLNVEKIASFVQELPEISNATTNIIRMIQRNTVDQREFSKDQILQKINKFNRSVEKVKQLQDQQCRDRSKAMCRAGLNASLLGGAILSVVLNKGVTYTIGGPVGFGVAYMVLGTINQNLETPNRQMSGEADLPFGCCFGPWYACNEAIVKVPERIVDAEEEVKLRQEKIVSDFNHLIDLARFPEKESSIRSALIAKITSLRTKIDGLTKSALYFNSDKFEKMPEEAKVYLAYTVSSINKDEEKETSELATYEKSLKELDCLISYIQQNILPNITHEEVGKPSQVTSEVKLSKSESVGLGLCPTTSLMDLRKKEFEAAQDKKTT